MTHGATKAALTAGTWWDPGRVGSLGERIADAIVHGVGLVTATALGTLILVFGALGATPYLPAVAVYLGALFVVLTVSLAYNMLPVSRARRVFARLDQAAIFLFIAATYTPFIAAVGGTAATDRLAVFVWSASVLGVALKLIAPHRFGRVAILLYLAIGWSGVLAFGSLSATLPTASLWLLVWGGIVYSLGIVFHLWERLLFRTALWHAFVVAGATLHLVAMLVMTLQR